MCCPTHSLVAACGARSPHHLSTTTILPPPRRRVGKHPLPAPSTYRRIVPFVAAFCTVPYYFALGRLPARPSSVFHLGLSSAAFPASATTCIHAYWLSVLPIASLFYSALSFFRRSFAISSLPCAPGQVCRLNQVQYCHI